jgi:hypothetical protein
MEYYVYIYYYGSVPIYVGKGKNNRYLVHLNKCVNVKSGKTPFYDKLKNILDSGEKPNIEIFLSGLTEEMSLVEERKLQIKFGSKFDGTGTLYNYAECGRKNPVLKGDKNPMAGRHIFDIWEQKYGNEVTKQKKEEYSKKMSKVVSGRTHDETTKEIMKSRKKNYWNNLSELDKELFKQKISESHTNERKEKFKDMMIQKNKNRKGEKHHKSVKCIVDGIIFNSLNEVCVHFGFKNHNTVTNRLKSINFPNWNYYN